MNNSHKVENSKVEVPNTTIMTDKDYLNDLLASLKSMVNHYSYALNEMSNRSFYDEIKKIFDETSNLQRLFFDYLFQRGWYCLETSLEQKVQETKQKMEQQITEMI